MAYAIGFAAGVVATLTFVYRRQLVDWCVRERRHTLDQRDRPGGLQGETIRLRADAAERGEDPWAHGREFE